MDNSTVHTMNKWAIEPLDVVAVWIHDHYFITEDRHWQHEHSTQWHCKGEITQPKPEILKDKNVSYISRSKPCVSGNRWYSVDLGKISKNLSMHHWGEKIILLLQAHHLVSDVNIILTLTDSE